MNLFVEDFKELERSAWIDTKKEADDFLTAHPEHKKQYEKWKVYMNDLKEKIEEVKLMLYVNMWYNMLIYGIIY